jgi:tryptophan halogenase
MVVGRGLWRGFLHPPHSTSIHLVQSGIAKLLALFPDRRFNPVERDEYNRQMQDVFEDVRDFIILHFKATRREDSDFWNYCRTMEVPDKLAAKLELWRSKGRIFREGAELFGTASWVAVLLGQGLIPEAPEPAAYAADEAKVADLLDRMRLSYRHTAEQMPTHAEFIARCCAAAPVVPR